jgi:hypothetical protein
MVTKSATLTWVRARAHTHTHTHTHTHMLLLHFCSIRIFTVVLKRHNEEADDAIYLNKLENVYLSLLLIMVEVNRRMVACFSPRRPGFNCRVVRVKSVMEKVTMGWGGGGRGSLSTSILPCQSVFHPRSSLIDNEGLVQYARLWPQDQQTHQYRQSSIVKKRSYYLLLWLLPLIDRPLLLSSTFRKW